MALWTTLAEGSSLDEFQASLPSVSELPKDTRIRLAIETPWYAPVAPLADLFGAEWVAQRLLAEGGAIVTDVEGVGWHKIVVHMKSDPVQVVLLIFAIAALLFGAGFLIASIKLDAEQIVEMGKWGVIALIALGALVLIGPRRRPVRESGKVAAERIKGYREERALAK